MDREQFSGTSDQRKAAIHRRDDAQALFDASRWRGAMYMAGYAVECMLKMRLMQRYKCRNLPALEQRLRSRGYLSRRETIFTHELEVLLRMAGGLQRLRKNAALWETFTIVNRWMPGWRYNPDASNRQDARDFLSAVDKLQRWIENNL